MLTLTISCKTTAMQTGINPSSNKIIKDAVCSNNIIFHTPPKNKKLLNIHGNLPTGIPLGNGSFGGILNPYKTFFDIQFNHTNFWRYDPETKYHPEYGARPFGLACLKCSWNNFFNDSNVTYLNELNLYEAISQTTLANKNQRLEIESWFDVNDDLAVFSLKPEGKQLDIELTFSKWRPLAKVLVKDDQVLIYDEPELSRSKSENDYLRKLDDKNFKPLKSSQAIGLKIVGGNNISIKENLNKVVVKISSLNDEKLTILVKAKVLERPELKQTPVEPVIKTLSSISTKDIETIKQTHFEWWKNYWDASHIILDSKDTIANRWQQFWYMQLYAMGSSNRAIYPAKMNGSIWTVDHDDRPWGGGYWHYNQTNMHGSLLAANHPDYTLRYLNKLTENLDIIKAQTKDLWGHGGIFVHETHSPDGLAYEFNRKDIYNNTSTWTSRIFSTTLEIAYQMYQYAKYTGDEYYMKDTVYPFLKGACNFYAEQLKKDTTGVFYIYPSNAHENFWSVKNPHTDMAAIYRCFPLVIDLCKKYGDKKDEIHKYEYILKNMSPFPIGKAVRDTSLGVNAPVERIDTSVDVFAPCEFVTDWKTHNYSSVDTYSTFPFELTTANHPLYKTAVNTVKNSFFPKITNSLMRRMISAAILNLPSETADLVTQYIKISQIAPNRLGNSEVLGDLTMALNYMLIHSFKGVIQIAPSLPKGWNAEFKLLAQGPVEVTAQVKDRKTTYLSLYSKKDQTIKILNPWNTEVEIKAKNGDTFYSKSDTIKWKAKKGGSFSLSPKDKAIKYIPLYEK